MKRLPTGKLVNKVQWKSYAALKKNWYAIKQQALESLPLHKVPPRPFHMTNLNPHESAFASPRDRYMGWLRQGWKRRVPKQGGHTPPRKSIRMEVADVIDDGTGCDCHLLRLSLIARNFPAANAMGSGGKEALSVELALKTAHYMRSSPWNDEWNPPCLPYLRGRYGFETKSSIER